MNYLNHRYNKEGLQSLFIKLTNKTAARVFWHLNYMKKFKVRGAHS
jgi:hypothetical protein